MSECIFCSIVKGDVPSFKIWEDEKYLAFLSIFPNTDATAVVIPKEHCDSAAFEDVDHQTMAELTVAAQKAAKRIQLAFEDVGRVALVCEGLGVNHLHVKLFPMHGTGDMDKWEVREDLNKTDFYETYPGYISSHDSEMADMDKLKQIADTINAVKI